MKVIFMKQNLIFLRKISFFLLINNHQEKEHGVTNKNKEGPTTNKCKTKKKKQEGNLEYM